MKLAGKIRPDIDMINEFVANGFTNFELHLKTNTIDNLGTEQIIENCKQSDGVFTTVHTPHTNDKQSAKKYIRKTDEIASALKSTLVMDSNPTSTRYLPNIYPKNEISAPSYGYENDPSVSSYYIKNYHLPNNYPLILDTAHLHMSESDIQPIIEELLSTHTVEEIPAIHLADGTTQNDGIAYGKGTIDIKNTIDLIDKYNYSGPVVLEKPKETQKDALTLVEETLS